MYRSFVLYSKEFFKETYYMRILLVFRTNLSFWITTILHIFKYMIRLVSYGFSDWIRYIRWNGFSYPSGEVFYFFSIILAILRFYDIVCKKLNTIGNGSWGGWDTKKTYNTLTCWPDIKSLSINCVYVLLSKNITACIHCHKCLLSK